MTTKILDSTVIIVSSKEIFSINLIEKCLKRYTLATSIEVYNETKDSFNMDCYKKICIFDLRKDKFFIELSEYLSNRYPQLHKGEISSFLVALIEYALKNKEYFFVTDDNAMRKVISKIFDDKLFMNKLQTQLKNFNVTGTIGLLRKLYHRNILTKEEIKRVADDLLNSTFRVTPELVKEKLIKEI